MRRDDDVSLTAWIESGARDIGESYAVWKRRKLRKIRDRVYGPHTWLSEKMLRGKRSG